ncbi:MAG: PTS mannitol transporter subunit IIBC, partial [Planctomycetes bacterium]|nr:PTS mannitol transporter subunit IIBC [Planctomycetota bacterium]
ASLGSLAGKSGPLKIIFACDAGMGSSAMSASILTKKLKEGGINAKVINKAVADIPPDADIVVTHRDLTERAKHTCPTAVHISINDYLNAPEYDQLVADLKAMNK